MLTIPVSILTRVPTSVPRELVSLSHRLGFARHYHDETKRENVTDERKGIEPMDEHEWLAEQFEANRTHLQAVAYRMLGSLSEADDAVQESWLRLSRSDTSGVENLGGWLTTVVARICLDMLRSRNSRREESLEAAVSESIESREEGIDQIG